MTRGEAIPVFINLPDRNLFWSWEETNIFLVSAIGGFFLMPVPVWLSGIVALLIGALSVRGYKKLKNSKYGDLTTCGFYWLSFDSRKRFKSLPASYIRSRLL